MDVPCPGLRIELQEKEGWDEKRQLCFLGRLTLLARSNTYALDVKVFPEEKWRLTFDV